MKRKIGIIVPDGVGIKNYLFSSVLKELKKNNLDFLLLHKLSNEAIEAIKNVHTIDEIEEIKLPRYDESILSKFLRELIALSRLKYNNSKVDNRTLMENWKPSKSSIALRIFYTIVTIISLFVRRYNSILFLEKLYNKTINTNDFEDVLKKNNIDMIINTHQRAIIAIPVVRAAKNNNITTYGVIYSWDNLPKARLSVRTEHYLVWSDYMKKEMEMFYPEIKKENIHITGTPQFEFYEKKEMLWDKDVFFKKFDLDIHKKIICFSGDDVRTSPNDPIYLEDLAEEIIKLKEENQPQILFRRCPVDLSDRYDSVLGKYSKIIKVATPVWRMDISEKNDWTLIYPTYDDVELLVNTVYHTDVVINVASTMAHDFAVFEKPCIYINYNQKSDRKTKIETIYNFQHFRSMQHLKPVFWLNSKEEISTMLLNVFNSKDSKIIIKDAVKWLNIISFDRENASKNIVSHLLKS